MTENSRVPFSAAFIASMLQDNYYKTEATVEAFDKEIGQHSIERSERERLEEAFNLTALILTNALKIGDSFKPKVPYQMNQKSTK